MTVKLDGATLHIQDVARVARPDTQGRFAQAALHPEARERIAATRAYIDRTWMHDDAPLMYAFNTGVGLFKDQRVHVADMADYQRKTVYAHATGVGEPFAEDVTRAMMLLRANAFASNYSGPRGHRARRVRSRFRARRQGCLRAHQRVDRVAGARRARDPRRPSAPEACRYRDVPLARGDARRARRFRPAGAPRAPPSRPGQGGAQP